MSRPDPSLVLHKNAKGDVIASNSYTLDKIGNRLGNASQDRRGGQAQFNVTRGWMEQGHYIPEIFPTNKDGEGVLARLAESIQEGWRRR